MKLVDRLTAIFSPSQDSLSAAEQAFAVEMKHREMIVAHRRGDISSVELQQFRSLLIPPMDTIKLAAIAERNKA